MARRDSGWQVGFSALQRKVPVSYSSLGGFDHMQVAFPEESKVGPHNCSGGSMSSLLKPGIMGLPGLFEANSLCLCPAPLNEQETSHFLVWKKNHMMEGDQRAFFLLLELSGGSSTIPWAVIWGDLGDHNFMVYYPFGMLKVLVSGSDVSIKKDLWQ